MTEGFEIVRYDHKAMGQTDPDIRFLNQEIADKLFISLPTVKTHVAHILAKINARDRVQAVVFAYENHLV